MLNSTGDRSELSCNGKPQENSHRILSFLQFVMSGYDLDRDGLLLVSAQAWIGGARSTSRARAGGCLDEERVMTHHGFGTNLGLL